MGGVRRPACGAPFPGEGLTAQAKRPARRQKGDQPEDREFEELHPRDAIGRFIQKEGEVQIGDATVTGPDGRRVNLKGQRGRVKDFRRDPNTGQVKVRVAIRDRQGREREVELNPRDMQAVREKARLDRRAGRQMERQVRGIERRQAREERRTERMRTQAQRQRAEHQKIVMKWAMARGWDPRRESLEDWREERWADIERDARSRGWDGNSPLGNFLQKEREARAREQGWNPKTQSYKDWRESRAAADGWNPREETVEEFRMRKVAESEGIRRLTQGQREAMRRGWRPHQESIQQYRQRRGREQLERREERRERRQERREDRREARQERREDRAEAREDRNDADRELSDDLADIRETREEKRERRQGESEESYERRQRDADRAAQDAEEEARERHQERIRAIRSSGETDTGTLWDEVTDTVYGGVLVAAVWDPSLHPRGRDGKFIEKLGMVELVDFLFKGGDGRSKDLSGRRGKVVDIVPDPDDPGNPDVKVAVMDDYGTPRVVVTAKPDNLIQAADKARLRPAGDQRTGPPTAQEKLAMDSAELARVRGEMDARERARAQISPEQRRAQEIAKLNADTADLSTDDAELRSHQLDAVLSKLRKGNIDTDKIHDHLYPPEEPNGRWTAERDAMHEEMWEDLLAQVEAAGIPQDRDALVLGGLPGAGKSYSLRPGQKADHFGVVSWETNNPVPPGATHVSINPDIVKEMLIDRGMLVEGIENLKPMEQVTFIHEESSYLGKKFLQRLGDMGYNVVLDNTMDSPAGMLKRMTPLARNGYRFRALFVDIPVEESRMSARQRYIDAALTDRGGRFVPSSVTGNAASRKGNMSKNRDAMDDLVADDWFTDWMIIDNTGISERKPKGEVVAQGQGDGSAAGAWLPENDRKRRGNQAFTAPTAVIPEPTAEVEAPVAVPV